MFKDSGGSVEFFARFIDKFLKDINATFKPLSASVLETASLGIQWDRKGPPDGLMFELFLSQFSFLVVAVALLWCS
jgi:hypothetical protein